MALLSSFLPTLMLSGFIFPIASMPAVLQAITTSCRRATSWWRCAASLLKGVALCGLFWRELAALAVFAALVMLALASVRLARRQWR